MKKWMVACVLMLGLAPPVLAAVVTPQTCERLTEQLRQAIAECRRLAQEVAPYDAVFCRDPLRPLVDAQGQVVAWGGLRGGLSVQGVIWSEDRPMAVIDDELFRQGDMVGPYSIVSIQPDGVVVHRHQGETLFVPLDRGLETP